MQDEIACAVRSWIRPPPNFLFRKLLKAFHDAGQALFCQPLLRTRKKHSCCDGDIGIHGRAPRLEIVINSQRNSKSGEFVVVTQFGAGWSKRLPAQKNGRPLQNLPPTTQGGFVAAVPSRGFRDGTGIFMVKLSHCRIRSTAALGCLLCRRRDLLGQVELTVLQGINSRQENIKAAER